MRFIRQIIQQLGLLPREGGGGARRFCLPLLALICAAALAGLYLAPSRAADYWSDAANKKWYGDGKSTDFYISTSADLAGLAQLVNEGKNFKDKTIHLTADIDLGGAESWTPIGKADPPKPFHGTFDGGGYAVTGLYIKTDEKYQGLFGYIWNATVKDLSVSGSVSGGNYTGAVVGYAGGENPGSTIINCVSDAAVSGDSYVGGIAGMGHDVKNCISVPAVDEGEQFVGAIVGDADGDVLSNRFVSREIAGWDGVSYAGKAEPMTYDQLRAETGLPADFATETAVFKAEDTVVARINYNYGEPIPADRIPAVPSKDGYEGKWQYDGGALTYGRIIEAEYNPFVTALQATGDESMPDVLLDGSFNTTALAEITAFDGSLAGLPETKSQPLAYSFTVSGTSCGLDGYRVRVKKPDTFKKTGVYLFDGTKWEKADSSEDGSYLVFDAQGETVSFALIETHNYALWNLLLAAGILVILAVILLVVRKRKKARKTKKASAKAEKHDEKKA
ncbi:hypothetical protein [Cloacibacillus evryensis]|uniref:hypothetical protein n=1 Tax=Cloacibacillus evryensis TaxID=508460 RepID=UPI00241E222C|nr:hypothetical protein [Cloacibacillus evryensis]